MADPPRYPETGDDTGMEFDQGATTGPPRWVKVFGIIIAALILILLVLRFVGVGGNHGPGLHTGGGDTPPTSVTEDQAPGGELRGHIPPSGIPDYGWQ